MIPQLATEGIDEWAVILTTPGRRMAIYFLHL
jgi:hypothetical protein